VLAIELGEREREGARMRKEGRMVGGANGGRIKQMRGRNTQESETRWKHG
jgi:hypothetical protein